MDMVFLITEILHFEFSTANFVHSSSFARYFSRDALESCGSIKKVTRFITFRLRGCMNTAEVFRENRECRWVFL